MNKGFTIIESLVAITILIIGVLGPMTAATRGITDGLYASNQLIATYLAQEAIELASVQLTKNSNTPGVDFLADLSDCLSSNFLITCATVITPNGDGAFEFKSCANADGCQIAYDSDSGFYRSYPSGGTNFVGPIFTRTLKVKKLSETTDDPPKVKDVLLKAEVTWFNKTISKNLSLSRYVFNPKQ